MKTRRLLLLLLAPLGLVAQNVGIGTITPQAKLHVVGGTRVDGWLATTPGAAFPAAATINISSTVSSATISPVGGLQANAISYTAPAYEGQILYIFNGDADTATFVGTSIPGNQAGSFVYLAGGWRALAAGGGGTTAGWQLSGNAGTAPATNFVGTTDAQGLAFRTDNVERARIGATGNLGIGTPLPAQALDVVGSMQFTGQLLPNGNAGVAGQALISQGPALSPIWGYPSTGQSFSTIYGTGSLATPAVMTVIPGLSANINVPATGTYDLFIATTGGILYASGFANRGTQAAVGIYVDGISRQFQTVCPGNFSNLVNVISSWGMTIVVPNIAPGPHTVEIAGVDLCGGCGGTTISADASANLLQGVLTYGIILR